MSDDTNHTGSPPDRLTSLFRRAKDHRIAQWTIGYIAVAYGIQHGVTLTAEAYDWPHAVTRISMTLLALGLPLAIVLAWYHGDRTARRISSGELAVVSAVLLGISLVFYLFVRPTFDIPVRAPVVQANIAAPLSSGTALAVLPFANVSSDANQEFFSDGITDEIMTALAKIPSLSVVARESAFTFKGKTQDVRAIGKALGARYLVEGSVRKAEDRVRITAQLVRVDTGVSLWTDAYERDLKDVFAVQEDVARAIAVSLQAPLGLKRGENLIIDRAISSASYQDYLRAKALFRGRGVTQLDQAIAVLKKITAENAEFAPAWSLLSMTFSLRWNEDPARLSDSIPDMRRVRATYQPLAEAAAQRAVKLGPQNAGGYAAQAFTADNDYQRRNAETLLQKALEIDGSDPDALHLYGNFLMVVGRMRDALAVRKRLEIVEPFVPIFNIDSAVAFRVAGDEKTALGLLDKSGRPDILRAQILADHGQYSDAANYMASLPLNGRSNRDDAVRLLRAGPVHGTEPRDIPDLKNRTWVYFAVGLPSVGLDQIERHVDAVATQFETVELWEPSLSKLRQSERFKRIVRKLGLVDYWRKSGWPDLCHPTHDDDFECN